MHRSADGETRRAGIQSRSWPRDHGSVSILRNRIWGRGLPRMVFMRPITNTARSRSRVGCPQRNDGRPTQHVMPAHPPMQGSNEHWLGTPRPDTGKWGRWMQGREGSKHILLAEARGGEGTKVALGRSSVNINASFGVREEEFLVTDPASSRISYQPIPSFYYQATSQS